MLNLENNTITLTKLIKLNTYTPTTLAPLRANSNAYALPRPGVMVII